MARRRYQNGSVFLRGKRPPKWIGRYREDIVGEAGQVRRVKHSVVLGSRAELATRKLAQRRLELILARINAPEYRPGRISNVSDFIEKWRVDVLAQRKPTTIRAANAHLRCHIIPQFGKFKLDELSRERQQTFVTLISRTVSRKTVENVMGTLASVLTTARKWGYITETVKMADLVLPDAGEKIEARCFTTEQVRAIIAEAAEPYKTMFSILAMCGLRAGELLALKVDDLDFDRRLIHIRRSVNRGEVQSVKSRSSQKPLPMPDALGAILKSYIPLPRPASSEPWLFVNRRGHTFRASKVVQKRLWPILDRLNIPRCGLHAFRHFHSTMLLELGAAPQVAQAQMRHSDPRITLEVYGHIIGESQRVAVDKVAAVLAPTGPNSSVSGEWIQ